MRGTRSKNNCYKWVLYQKEQILEQAKMLSGRLEHQKIRKNSHSGNLNTLRMTIFMENHINVRNHSIRDPIEKKI